MRTGEQVNSEEISTVTSYTFLGALIANYGYTKDEIKRRITLGKAAMAKLTQQFQPAPDLVQTIVFPAVLYGCETWKADKRKLDAFELRTWTRLLRTSMDSKKDEYISE
jgi:hypothetical protein